MKDENKSKIQLLIDSNADKSRIFDEISLCLFKELRADPERWKELIQEYYDLLSDSKELRIGTLMFLLKNGASCTKKEEFLGYMLNQYPLESDELTELMSAYFFNIKHLSTVVTHLPPTNPNYAWCKLVSDCLQLEGEARRDFILKHLEIFAKQEQLKGIFSGFINALTPEDHSTLVRAYLKDPTLAQYKYFISESSLPLVDSSTLREYLATPNTRLPDRIVDICIRPARHADSAQLLTILMQRPDFPPFTIELTAENKAQYFDTLVSGFFYRLVDMTKYQNQSILGTVLAHPKTIELLKRYQELKIDERLSSGDQGLLLVRALAWYATQEANYDTVISDLLSTMTPSQRKAALNKQLPSVMNPANSTLREVMIQAGKGHLIGGINPRLIKAPETKGSKKYTSYNPSLWQNPQVKESVRSFQKAYARDFAKNTSNKSNKKMTASFVVQAQAAEAAKHCPASTLTLQHQTMAFNAGEIFSSGRLRSRFHIEGDVFNSKDAKGITNKVFAYNSAKSVVTYFTRVPQTEDQGVVPLAFSNAQEEQIQFRINGEQLLLMNPHYQYFTLGIYNNLAKKTLTLEDGTVLSSYDFSSKEGEVFEIPFNNNEKGILFSIHQKMLEIAIEYCINKLAEPKKTELLNRITNPKTPEDQQLIADLLDLIPLEWMFPGDVALRLAYIDSIQLGNKTYDLAALRNTALNEDSKTVLAAIKAFPDLQKFPFIITGLLQIALRRNQKEVIAELYKFDIKPQETTDVVYNPIEIYQIESLAQLMLEDFNNERVFVSNNGDSIVIEAVINRNTNQGGAHHAEMAILQHALHLGHYEGKDALECTDVPDNLTLPIGPNTPFASLATVMNALLTYEITTLVTSVQNLTYYENQQGQLHPETGKGATNGKVALRANRLFLDGKPYTLEVTAENENKRVLIKVSETKAVSEVVLALQKSLGLSTEDMQVSPDNNQIEIKRAPSELIARLRQQATCYEGINVLTEDGRLLLANRHNRGLASAGGHHSDKYCKKSIGHGLESEFGLRFNEPARIQKEVDVVEFKSTARVGIYLVHAASLTATPETKAYAQSRGMDIEFKADPEEFNEGSEVALTLVEMRGRSFYEVMPLAELCEYQLKLFKDFIQENYPELKNIEYKIETGVDTVNQNKIPNATFGRISLSVNGDLPQNLEHIFSAHQVDLEPKYVMDVSPMVLIQEIKADQTAKLTM